MSLSPKQPLKKLKLKLYLEKFFVYELWQHLLIIAVLCLCAWLFNKPFETLMFLIAHWTIRGSCSKQFHCNSVGACLTVTFTVIVLSTLTVLPITVSLLASIPLALFITYLGYLIQFKIDNTKGLYSLSENEFIEYCKACGLSPIDTKIAYFIVIKRLKGQEFYKAIGYSESQAKRKRKYILKVLNKI